MNPKKILIILFVFLTASVSCADDMQVFIGNLSHNVIRSLLSGQLGDARIPWPNNIEESGTRNGFKYHATIQDINSRKVLDDGSDNRFTLTFAPGNLAILHFDLPNAELSASLHVEAQKKIPKVKGPFAFFAAPLSLSLGVASTMSSVDRKYSVHLKGFHGMLTFKLDAESQKLRIVQTKLHSINFSKKIELLENDDAIGAVLLNGIIGGSVDDLVEKMVVEQMTQPSFVQRFALPIKDFLESHLTLPAEVVFTNPLGLRNATEINGAETGKDFFSSAWSVALSLPNGIPVLPDHSEQKTATIPTDAIQSPLNPDEVRVVLPLLMLEKVTDVLAQNGQFNVSGKTLSVKFEIKPSGKVKVNATRNGAFKFEIPVHIALDSSLRLLPGETTGLITVIARPRFDATRGIVLDFISSSVTNVRGRVFSILPSLSDRILSEVFRTQIRAAFPTEALIVSRIPVTPTLGLQSREIQVLKYGLGVTFDLKPQTCAGITLAE